MDRDTNGGIAGNDVRIIETNSPVRTVNVRGIDNHELTSIPIVTCAGVVTTQKGPITLIMNQYASIGKGHSIHSFTQLEHHGNHIDDKALPNDGLQGLVTANGYVIPFAVRDGLVYMDIHPPMDDELHEGPNQLP